MKYKDFLQNKAIKTKDVGFKVEGSALNPMLFDFQKAIVHWSLQKGKSAIFADCGLGKTPMQLDWGNQIWKRTNKPILILAPLAVSLQTKHEGEKFGIPVKIIRTNEDIVNGINITNYENLKNIDATEFIGIILDESSILKNFTGKYKRMIIDEFENTPYKLCCTATPSPNDNMELGNHAEFLNIMPSNEMISRWFINDTMAMCGYRLKKHSEKDYWKWVSTWAMCISLPSDIGFEDRDFILPSLDINETVLDVPETPKNGELFNKVKVNASGHAKELRTTIDLRLNHVANIVNNSNETFILWVKLNDESTQLHKMIPDSVEVRGSDKVEKKEDVLIGFAKGKYRVLITKSKIAQFGLNFQNCHNQIFASIDFSFEALYQSIRRSYRFGQKESVNINIITTNTMSNVIDSIRNKNMRYLTMQKEMSKAISETYNTENSNLKLETEFTHRVERGNDYELHLGDSCEVIKEIKDNSVDFSIFSPPFSNLYIYSNSIRDMGNSENDAQFYEHFTYLIKELKRVLRPGRLIAVHCKQLVNYKNTNGKSGLRDFRGDLIRLFVNEDFSYHSEVTIWKSPVTEMYKTNTRRLGYGNVRKDSSLSGVGLNEYLILFRKWSENEHDTALEVPINWKTKDNFPLETWQEWASPVWIDIKQTNVLNIRSAKDDKDEKHICPLQLDIIDRAVRMWTNENEVVFSPFAGIGSEGYGAIKANRKFIGIELKEKYFEQSITYLNEIDKDSPQLDLFEDSKKKEDVFCEDCYQYAKNDKEDCVCSLGFTNKDNQCADYHDRALKALSKPYLKM